jgi:hypothetical protein
MPATWECPSCKRRVPLSVEECRCGWLRSRVAVAPPRPSEPARGTTRRSWEVWAVVAVVVVCLGWGVYVIVSPPAPSPAVGILGYVDPTPPPKPTARVTPARTATTPTPRPR